LTKCYCLNEIDFTPYRKSVCYLGSQSTSETFFITSQQDDNNMSEFREYVQEYIDILQTLLKEYQNDDLL
jgi:hypothetical protein